MKKYLVRWLEEHEVIVVAENEEEARDVAMELADKGEDYLLERFDFRVYEDEE